MKVNLLHLFNYLITGSLELHLCNAVMLYSKVKDSGSRLVYKDFQIYVIGYFLYVVVATHLLTSRVYKLEFDYKLLDMFT